MTNDAIPTVPVGYQAVTPWIIARGVPRLIDFLVDVFDAEEVVRMLDADGVRVTHAEVRIGGAAVMMFDSADGWPPTPAFLRVYVPDCEQVLRRAADSGGRIVTEPTEMFFGDRIGRFADPWDNLWWVHTRFAEPTAEELAATLAPEQVEAMAQVADTLSREMSSRGQT
jgi:PhnB protein